MECSTPVTNKEIRPCTLYFDNKLFLQLFSNEGDEQKLFQQTKQNLNTADLSIRHGKGNS
jgi:hypothetical protein